MGTTRSRSRRVQDTSTRSTAAAVALLILVALDVCQLSRGNPVFVDNPSLAQFQSGRNIRHLPCIVRKSGLSGVCMFAIDCIKQNGTHLGTCIDRFYFGSCCQMKDDTKIFAEEISDNSIDQNTISHFSHESSTLSTISNFKVPTESFIETLGLRNHSTLHPYVPVSTITHMASKVDSTTTRYITSRRPSTTTSSTTTTTTTTTAAPITTRRTSASPTRRRTTTPLPMLTRAPETTFEDIFEATTMPTKFTTFQMVETSTPNRPTEPALFEDTTMRRTTRRPVTTPPRTKKPLITRIPAANFTATPPTTARPTTRTTPKYKPTLVKRPTTTKKPSKRPAVVGTTLPTRVRPTRKPVTHHEAVNATTSSPTRTDSSSTVRTTVSAEPTTRAPRPKLKPTAEIFKVPRPTVGAEPTTLKVEPKITSTTASPSTSTSTTTTTTTTTTPAPTTTTTPRTTTTRRTTTTHRPTTTTTTTTTTPAPTTTPKTTTTTTTSTTTISTTTTRRPTTQKVATTESLPEPTSTYRPTLVTWTTVVDNKPNNTHVTIEETAWQPKPPPADWVPVPTIDPEVVANKTAPVLETASSPLEPTTEGIRLPSSTPTPAVETTTATALNTSSITLSTTTTTEGAPSTSALPSTSTVKTTTTTSTVAPTTSGKPIVETSTATETSSEENFTETPTAEMTTPTDEDFNATTVLPFTTMSPMPSLEGVDYRQVCGRRMFPEPRIVGGSNAAFGRWPWQISLRQWRTSTYLHKCGAALLNENWAITAAHCVDNVPPSDLLLRLGEYDLAEEEEPYGYQERRVQIVASHPQFDPRTFEYDLALLRFYEPVVFQPNIIPVCVPGSDEDFIGQTAFVTGWGRLYEDGPLPSVLQEVAVPIINNTICETMYRAAGYIEHIPHIFICAGWKKGGYDSCEGDSGGPMVLQREADKRFILGGVISWGIGCAEPNQPGVYTRISEFRDWVNQILQF